MRNLHVGTISKILLFVLVFGLDACKVRKEQSGLSASDPNVAYTNMQTKLAEIETRGRVYTTGAPLIDDLTLQYIKKREGQPGNRVEVPPGCPKNMWVKDFTWQNEYISDLVGYIQDDKQPQLVRLEALKVLANLTSQNFATCWEQKVEQLMGDAFMSVAPPKETWSNEARKGEITIQKWSCANVITCSIAIEVALNLAKIMPDNKALDVVLLNLLDTNESLEMIGYRDLYSYRISSVMQLKKFFAMTGIYKPENRGQTIIFSANDGKFRELKESLSILMRSFSQFYLKWSTPKAANNVLYANIRSQYWMDIIKQIYDDPMEYLTLADDAPEKAIIDSYANSAVSQFLDLYRFNTAMYFYLDRLTMKDPKPWYSKLKKQVLIGTKITEELELLNGDAPEDSSGKEISFEDYQRNLYKSYKLDYDSLDDQAIEPEIALLAITTFVSYEVYLPYRADLFTLLKYISNFMTPESKMEHQKNFADANLYFAAFEKQRTSYGKGALQLQGEDYEIPKDYKPELLRVGATFDRLAKIEVALAKKRGYEAFQSLHHEYEVLVALLNKRQASMHKLIGKLKEDPTYKTGKFSNLWNGFGLVSDQELEGTYRVLLSPGSGIDEYKFDLSNKTFDVMGQWIFIQCLERNNQDLLPLKMKREAQEAGQSGRKLAERFFIDQKDIHYVCPDVSESNRAYTDLKSRVFSYTRKHALSETKNELAKAIKDHPAAHGAMMLAMCMVVPPLGQLALRLPFILGSRIPRAIQALNLAKIFAGFASKMLSMRIVTLMFDSFIFGVGEFVFSSNLTKMLGVKIPEEEHAMHESALFNLKGIVMGAVIFGILPLAHGPVDAIIRRSFLAKGILGRSLARRVAYASAKYESRLGSSFLGRILPKEKLLNMGLFQGKALFSGSKIAFKTSTERLRVWALTAFSWSAQYGAEVSIFTFSPLLQAQADEMYLKFKGEYKEPDEFEKVWSKLYTPNALTGLVSSMITAGAFTVNRASGTAARAAGYDGLKNTSRLWGIKRLRAKEAAGGKPPYERVTPYEELGVPRNISQQDIIGVHEYKQQILYEQLREWTVARDSVKRDYKKSGSTELAREVKTGDAKIASIEKQLQRLTAAKMILLGEKGWQKAAQDHKDLWWPEIGDLPSGSWQERQRQVHELLYADRLSSLKDGTKDRLLKFLQKKGYKSSQLKPWHGSFISDAQDHDSNIKQKTPSQFHTGYGGEMF